jgi:hypothetical protein
MKRYLPLFITILIVMGIVSSVSYLLWRKTRVEKATTFTLDPAKRLQAEQTCKMRLKYDELHRKCSKKSGKKEGLCKEDLEKKLQDCIHLELIRNAESIDDALAIEQEYLGRPLTSDEKLAVTAETMFDEYELR